MSDLLTEDESAAKGQRLNFVAGRNSKRETIEAPIGYSSTVVKDVFDQGKAIVLTGTDQGKAMGSESAVMHNLRSIMAVPLKLREKTLGVVYVDSHLAKGLFTKDDLEVFSAVSNYIAIAFEMARIARVELEKANLQNQLQIQSAIAAESRKVAILVDNMQQALFSIDEAGMIVEPVSRFTNRLFANQVNNKNVLEILFKDLPPEKLGALKSALSSVFGEDELQWDLAVDNFPKKIHFDKDGQKKVLKILPSPIYDQEGKVEKVLFVVEDVSSLEELETKLHENRRQALIFEEIIAGNPAKVGSLLTAAIKMLKEKQTSPPVNRSEATALLRDLHTMKGSARLFGLRQLSELIHVAEGELEPLKSDGADFQGLKPLLIQQFEKLESVAEKYIEVLKKIRPAASSSAGKAVDPAAVAQLKEAVKQLQARLQPEQISAITGAVRRLVNSSAKELISSFEPMISDLGQELNRKVKLEISGTDAFISDDQSTALRESLVHLLRNSVDHGIEEPEKRIQAGKPEFGTIHAFCSEADGFINIDILDDGKGMDDQIILQKAIQKKIVTEDAAAKLSREERLSLIFVPNFSTKEIVSEVSGRGIGMDAVKEGIARIKGEIKLSTDVGKGTKFSIRFPMETT